MQSENKAHLVKPMLPTLTILSGFEYQMAVWGKLAISSYFGNGHFCQMITVKKMSMSNHL